MKHNFKINYGGAMYNLSVLSSSICLPTCRPPISRYLITFRRYCGNLIQKDTRQGEYADATHGYKLVHIIPLYNADNIDRLVVRITLCAGRIIAEKILR